MFCEYKVFNIFHLEQAQLTCRINKDPTHPKAVAQFNLNLPGKLFELILHQSAGEIPALQLARHRSLLLAGE
jgi:hypothetical protein